jgi:SanA protein
MYCGAASMFLCVIISLSSYHIIKSYGKKRSYELSQLNDIPHNQAALVLGTSQYLSKGRKNLYFQFRIQTAAKLYFAGKVNYIIVSGDNSHFSYNEPVSMRKALQKLGVPDSAIYLDFAGFRTLDSMVRTKEIFGQKKVTVVSQDFHNHRAIFIASRFGIEAIGCNAPNVNLYIGFKTLVREYLARVKVFMDIYILHTTPKYLGKPVILGEKQIH